MKKRTTTLLLTMVLTGCANGIPTPVTYSDTTTDNTKMLFLGIPFIAGFSGSKVQLDDEWIVTSEHHAFIAELQGNEVYYHPSCDLALYRQQGDGSTDLAPPYVDEPVTQLGYPFGLFMSKTESVFKNNITTIEYPDCEADVLAESSGITVGFSGGGVYNQSKELVGITSSFYNTPISTPEGVVENPVVFISLYDTRDWLTKITGKTYFKETVLNEFQ